MFTLTSALPATRTRSTENMGAMGTFVGCTPSNVNSTVTYYAILPAACVPFSLRPLVFTVRLLLLAHVDGYIGKWSSHRKREGMLRDSEWSRTPTFVIPDYKLALPSFNTRCSSLTRVCLNIQAGWTDERVRAHAAAVFEYWV